MKWRYRPRPVLRLRDDHPCRAELRRNGWALILPICPISLIEKRLGDAFPGITYKAHGTPKDLDGAKALAANDKLPVPMVGGFLVDAVPYGGKKKGADTGALTALSYFKPDGRTPRGDCFSQGRGQC